MRAKAAEHGTTERVLRWLREREDEMAALLSDLVAVPTENPPGRHYEEFAEFGLLSVAHGPDEYMDLRRVTECAMIYAFTAAKTLGRKVELAAS